MIVIYPFGFHFKFKIENLKLISHGINTRHQKTDKIRREYPENNPGDGDGFGC